MSYEEKLCPLFHGYCQKECAIWDDDENRCSIASIAANIAQLKQIESEIYWLRRHMEGCS